jgi:hypothetical protein
MMKIPFPAIRLLTRFAVDGERCSSAVNKVSSRNKQKQHIKYSPPASTYKC